MLKRRGRYATSSACSRASPSRQQAAAFASTSVALTKDLDTHKPLKTTLTGRALLNAPAFNKGTAFTLSERKDFRLAGLLPCGIQTLEEQVDRAYQQYTALNSDILRNSFMTSL